MCDFSLHNVKSRPAKVGDKLTTHNFNTGTCGFAAPEHFCDMKGFCAPLLGGGEYQRHLLSCGTTAESERNLIGTL